MRLPIAGFLLAILFLVPLTLRPQEERSTVYVSAVPCDHAGTGLLSASDVPVVSLDDERFYADFGSRSPLKPAVTVTTASAQRVDFHFDAPPGSYAASVRFPSVSRYCGSTGPLIIIPGKNRHLFVSAFEGTTDWHARAAVAGTLPVPGLHVAILSYQRTMNCGEPDRSWDQSGHSIDAPMVTYAEDDDGAFYGNFHAYGSQNRTVALALSGDLFSSGVILLSKTPTTAPNVPPFFRKDITLDALYAAMANPGKLTCVDGF